MQPTTRSVTFFFYSFSVYVCVLELLTDFLFSLLCYFFFSLCIWICAFLLFAASVTLLLSVLLWSLVFCFFQIIYVLLFSCWALFKRRPGELQLRHLCCEWKTLYCDDSCHFVILIHWLIWTMHDRIIVHNVCVVWQLPTQIISQLFTHCYLDLVAANESEHVLYV